MKFLKIFTLISVLTIVSCGGESPTSSTSSPEDQDNSNNTPIDPNSPDNQNTNSNTNPDPVSAPNSNSDSNTNSNSNSNSNDSGPSNQAPAAINLTDLCPDSQTLEVLIDCIRDHIPTKHDDSQDKIDNNENEHEIPSQTVLNQWTTVIQNSFNNNCDDIVLPELIAERYIVKTFTDIEKLKSYCLLYEVIDENENGKVDKGWGTFIIDPNPKRNLNIQVPHPIDDNGTALEGITIFKETESRTFMMAGTRRQASHIDSSCDNNYKITDVAHNIQNLFQISTIEMKNYYESNNINDYVVLQLHKIADTTCGENITDTFLTYGKDQPIPAGSDLENLINNLKIANPDWNVRSPSDNPADCNKFGSRNTQGRLLNGSDEASVCDQSAPGFTEKFIHIEQKNCCNQADSWINSIKLTFPEI